MPPAPTISRDTLRDRFRGALLGTLLGDALGAPFEGTAVTDLAWLQRQVDARAMTRQPWGYTDDGEMTLAVAEAIVAADGVDATQVVRSLAARHEPARGYGKGLRRTLEAWQQGIPLSQLGSVVWPEGSRGNGGAVRIAPVALLHASARAGLFDDVDASARPTHAHADAIMGARLVAMTIVQLLAIDPGDLDSRHLVAELIAFAGTGTYAARLQKIPDLLAGSPLPREVARTLGNGVLALESVPAALHTVLRDAGRGFEATVRHAVGLGGDTDSIGAMAGAMAGALHGAAAIPRCWLQNLAEGERDVEAATALADRLLELALTR